MSGGAGGPAGARPLRGGGLPWWRGPGAAELDDAALVRCIESVLAQWRSGALPDWKRDPSKHMVRASPGEGAPDVLLKVRRYPPAQQLRRRLLGGKARRELEMARRVARAGVSTPLPLAAGEERGGLGLRADFLLVPYLPGARDLRSFAAEEGDPRLRREAAHALGALTRALEAGGVFQEDFAPNNFLVAPQRDGGIRLQAIDFERAHLRAVDEVQLVFSLAKLLRELPRSRAAERRALLEGLRPGDRAAARRLWRAVARELPRQAARDLARLRRVVARDGRRFHHVRVAGVALLARRSLDAAGLARAASRGPEGSPLLWRPLASGSRAHVADQLARAELLYHRGLGPEPLCARMGPEAPWIAFRPLEGAAPPSREAVEALVRGLLAIGTLRGGLRAAAVVGFAGGARAGLVDATGLDVGGLPERPGQARRALLRGWAARHQTRG